MHNPEIEKSPKGVTYLYRITIFVLVFTGFGQLPIYQRYYLADIPGMAWAADFYTTHYLHYLAATLFIALVFYYAAEYFVHLRKRVRLTASGWFRTVVAAGLVVSGALMVYRNLPGYRFPQGVIMFLDLSHIGLAMCLLFAGLYGIWKKKRWTVRIR